MINDFNQSFPPLLLLFLIAEIKDARLGRRQDYLDRIECSFRIGASLWCELLNESTGKAVHHTTLFLILLSVAVDFVAAQHQPILPKSIGFSLQEARFFHMYRIAAFALLEIEIFQNLGSSIFVGLGTDGLASVGGFREG